MIFCQFFPLGCSYFEPLNLIITYIFSLGDSVSDKTESTALDSLSQDLEEEDMMGEKEQGDETPSPTSEPVNEPLSERMSNQIPLQRLAMSVRHKKHRGSKVLKAGWMIHFINDDREVGMYLHLHLFFSSFFDVS